MTTADLARAEGVTPQARGMLVAELEEARLGRRTEDDSDRRCRPASITLAGVGVIYDRRALRQTWLATTIERHLDARERQSLLDALALLRRITSS